MKVISIKDRVYRITEKDYNSWEGQQFWSAKALETFLLMVEEKYKPILIIYKAYEY